MKGYFSQIAKQSGLRISGQGGQSHGAENLRSDALPERLAPIEQIEAVMVPTIETRREEPGTLKTQKPSSKVKNPKKQTPREAAGAGSASPHAGRSSALPSDREEVIPVSQADELREKTETETTRAPVANPPIAVINQTELIEQPKGAGNPRILSTGALRNATSERKEPEKIKEGKYFSRTAQIIGGREAKPDEVQTILMSEVQEWVSGGPQSTDVSLESLPEEIETREFVQADEPEREPGVVRIGEQRRMESIAEESQYQSPGIQEQSFELSIGTISVVIEGDEKPLQPTQAQRSRSGQDSLGGGHRFSRLKRSFL